MRHPSWLRHYNFQISVYYSINVIEDAVWGYLETTTGPGYVKNTCPRRNVNPTPPSPLKWQGNEASDSNFEDIQPQNRLHTKTEPSKTRICDCCNAINLCDVLGTATEWQLISPIFFSELTPERCDVCRFFYSIVIQYWSLTKDNNCVCYFGAGPGSSAIRPKEARGHLS